uniref:Uncharacterized protein n=1 Tax=Meleagris gallopavo TaxID=9103 RepID=A0A803Y3R5_MELGA
FQEILFFSYLSTFALQLLLAKKAPRAPATKSLLRAAWRDYFSLFLRGKKIYEFLQLNKHCLSKQSEGNSSEGTNKSCNIPTTRCVPMLDAQGGAGVTVLRGLIEKGRCGTDGLVGMGWTR